MEHDEQGGDPLAERAERITADTPLDKLTDFQRGVRAMFDALTFRAANHWRPHAMDQCNYDNKLIYEWSEDALEEADPSTASEWKAIDQAFKDGVSLGKSLKVTETDNSMIDDHIDSLKLMSGVCGILFAFSVIAILISGNIKPDHFLWVLTFYGLVFLFSAIFITGKAYRLKCSQRGGAGFKPPRPLPPSTPPAGWTPKSQ